MLEASFGSLLRFLNAMLGLNGIVSSPGNSLARFPILAAAENPTLVARAFKRSPYHHKALLSLEPKSQPMLGAKTSSSMFHVNRALLFALGTIRRKSIALPGALECAGP